eukprot:TRINITY_DN59621_c0_g1_i2.p1 TRINITY_DN59621_c0_g1~~TRINITY_DN59621_c0_g1_i2.p1  ORF type:complete len:392 (-),score=29.23 TRINITY_DN59621_c0_g1_i2:62-1237(-)
MDGAPGQGPHGLCPRKECRGCRLDPSPFMSYQFSVGHWQEHWHWDGGAPESDKVMQSTRATRHLRGYIHSSHNRGPFHWVPFLEMFDWLLLQWNPGLYEKVENVFRWKVFMHVPGNETLPFAGAYLVRRYSPPRTMFITISCLPYFLRFVLKNVPLPGVIIYVGRGWEDAVVPDHWLRRMVELPKILHTFIENPQVPDLPRVTAMPIGMDPVFLQRPSGRRLLEIAASVPLEDKLPRAMSGFDAKGPVREAAKKYILSSPWLDWIDTSSAGPYGTRQIAYWEYVAKYRFVISPPAVYLGMGPRGPMVDTDSYRTTETLVLRTIPILWAGPNAWAWEGLPVVTVSDWSEVTPENMSKWWQEKKHLLEGEQPYLRSAYWWRKIEALVNATFGL